MMNLIHLVYIPEIWSAAQPNLRPPDAATPTENTI